MSIDFEKYAIKGNEFVSLITNALSVPKERAGRIIRAVFHSIRNRLTHEESFQLLAQLPMSLKGVYVDGWKFNKDLKRMVKHQIKKMNETQNIHSVSAHSIH